MILKVNIKLINNIDNIKTILYSGKAFMDKLNLIEVTVYMRNKM